MERSKIRDQLSIDALFPRITLTLHPGYDLKI